MSGCWATITNHWRILNIIFCSGLIMYAKKNNNYMLTCYKSSWGTFTRVVMNCKCHLLWQFSHSSIASLGNYDHHNAFNWFLGKSWHEVWSLDYAVSHKRRKGNYSHCVCHTDILNKLIETNFVQISFFLFF